MRIGRFAEENKLSIDAVRHYMDLGLIIPEKQGGQYFFDERCHKDLKDILTFKSMGFNLNEIKTIFFYKSLGKMTDYENDIYYRALFQDKYKNVEMEIQRLTEIKRKLKEKLDSMCDSSQEPGSSNGIDLKNLGVFSCHKCGKSLILNDGVIKNNEVTEGKLICSCGEEYVINSGILISGKPYEASFNMIDDKYASRYVNETDRTYLDNLHKGLDWASRKVSSCNLGGKILLELGSGIGFFLRSIYNELPEGCLYLAVDRNLERHKVLKNLIEKSGIRKNIIFICSDFLEIPIKKKSVDLLLDISGTSNYSFEHEEFLLSLVDFYMKDDSQLLATFIMFKNFSANSLIDNSLRKNFLMKNVKEEISKLKYKPLDERISDYVEKGGIYENFFVEGEKIFNYAFFGKR